MFDTLTHSVLSLRQSRFAQSALLTLGLTVSSAMAPTFANPLPPSREVFQHAPRIVRASTSQPAAFVSGGTYEFTLTLPADAGAPLQAIAISQAANAAKIQFAPGQSQVVANGVPVAITAIGGANGDDVTLVFDRPVQPGATVTLALVANRQSGVAGTYLFGITTYPTGDATNGLFLGYGRLSLLSPGG